jgi:hypothetical protein
MFDIQSYLPGKRKQTPSGWISFNAVCCGDRRQRGGLKASDQGWSYHCFNCSFTASFILGRPLSFKARKLLTLLNVPEAEIDMLNIESMRHRSIHGLIEDRQRTYDALADIKFEERDLPPFAELLSAYPEGNYWDYLKSRRVPMDYPYMIQIQNDGVHWLRPHVVIPFTHHDKIVGYTCRFIDGKSPKYISDSQPGYVFGTDLQHDSWQYGIVVEGIFDALSISGLAVMHNTVSDAQARIIRSLGKEIIVVPDQDTAGLELVDRAVELNWSVSIPEWPADVKDVNDAVVKYGKLGALLTILEARETSRIKIELRKKNLVRKLQY